MATVPLERQKDITEVAAQIRQQMGFSESLYNFGQMATAADKLPYATGAGTWGIADLTAFARQLLAAADADAARGVIGSKFFDTVKIENTAPVVQLTETDTGAVVNLVLDAGGFSLRFGSLASLHFYMTSDGSIFRWFGNDIIHDGNIRTKLAGLALGDVGTVGLFYNLSAQAFAAGSVIGGSFLVRSTAGSGNRTGTPVGTWRCLGYSGATGGNAESVSLWERIA